MCLCIRLLLDRRLKWPKSSVRKSSTTRYSTLDTEHSYSMLTAKGTDWVPMVLVGNKADLEAQRQVSKEDAMGLAAEWNCAWTESSARENQNVWLGFELCIEQIELYNSPPQEPKRGCLIL